MSHQLGLKFAVAIVDVLEGLIIQSFDDQGTLCWTSIRSLSLELKSWLEHKVGSFDLHHSIDVVQTKYQTGSRIFLSYQRGLMSSGIYFFFSYFNIFRYRYRKPLKSLFNKTKKWKRDYCAACRPTVCVGRSSSSLPDALNFKYWATTERTLSWRKYVRSLECRSF